MLNKIPPSQRLAILLSGAWLFVSGLFSLVMRSESLDDFDAVSGFLVTWLFVGIMPLGLIWGTVWVVSGYRRERLQVTIHEPAERLPTQYTGSLEDGRIVSRLEVLLSQHSTGTFVGVIVAVIAIAFWLMPAASTIEHERGFSQAFAYTLSSPIHTLVGTIGILLCARAFVAPWQRYWVGYQATLLAQLWVGAASMLGWALSALTDSEEIGMSVTIMLVFPGVAWVFGQFLKRSDGTSVGLFVGTKILALEITITLALLGLPALVLDMTLR